LVHPLWHRAHLAHERGELFREAPIVVRTEDGSLLDGVVDLAFRELGREGARIVLVDFKTDAEIDDLSKYAAQLGLYADALARALGEPVTQVLLRV
jgi:ATP-dependent exoDNAse (exonuclease V) beta subunit